MADSAPAEEAKVPVKQITSEGTKQDSVAREESQKPSQPPAADSSSDPLVKLPRIDVSSKTKADKKAISSATVSLPSIRNVKPSGAKSGRSQSLVDPGSVSNRERGEDLRDPYVLSPKDRNVNSNWKDNKDVESWLLHKESQLQERKSYRVRQAMKDANWILARREKQMKEIQKRQKAEKVGKAGPFGEEERVQPQEKRASNKAALQQFQKISQKVKFVASTVHQMGYSLPYLGSFPGGIGRHQGELTWQPCPALKKHKQISRDRDCGVW
eukprot:CAMPEP_0196585980 /NCGR_PEP_ID=MMETSP1081-20130531/52766_1 /TAXON_ID=36882 /ORGANISM="Pyramimonas amylifera, Strain CCMP720" /LENGTH=269 /DNA_ID=CAMNT_0041907709 /DNA_START=141 /DNA_END=947 /DNA_ORIENTATION=+